MLKNLLLNLFRTSTQVQKSKNEIAVWSGLESVIVAFNQKDYVAVVEQCRAALQQDIGEAAGRGAHVETGTSGWIDMEMV